MRFFAIRRMAILKGKRKNIYGTIMWMNKAKRPTQIDPHFIALIEINIHLHLLLLGTDTLCAQILMTF